MKGNEWAAEVSLKWLRGRDADALDREIEKIKKEIAVRKRERNSITQLLKPEVCFVCNYSQALFLIVILNRYSSLSLSA